MSNKHSKKNSKKSKNSKRIEKQNKTEKASTQEKINSQKIVNEYIEETILNSDVENTDADVDKKVSQEEMPIDTNTDSDNSDDVNDETKDINNYCEEIKAKQQELLGRIKNLSDAIVGLTLIRDSVNSISVDTITELYFTRQVRPLLDALNIISFATSNMSNAAIDFQGNAFADKKEIKNALNLSYRMNDEVDDIITALDRRLKIFLNEINKMDKNCSRFYFNKDS